eukprot:TRINITY_DN25658_c0_g1_i1.p1 TRINITY_DN25658_c0_g1~~TRINITY_DN25658_c0_g1_i1.p1  ORF type:complete len:171 (-),score=31.14 TRINITY_DN25658_c0_g1_i1:180-692(-)
MCMFDYFCFVVLWVQVWFFFFKQKTAYEMQRGLVGSEMCIRDSINAEYMGIRRVIDILRRPRNVQIFQHFLRLMIIQGSQMEGEFGEIVEIPRGLTTEAIEQLPIHKFQSCSGNSEQMCTICMESFKSEEEVLVLPCLHQFHPGCVTRWLEENELCPVCKNPVQSPNQIS